MQITYREIKSQDIEAIFDVRIQTWHHPRGAEELTEMGITPQTVRELMKTSHRGWLAERDGSAVGFVMGNKRTGEMWVIAVLPQFENRGIGKTLMSLVEEWLISEGCEELWLTTDPNESHRAVGFYRHLGWQDWKMEDGDRFMRKRTPSAPPPEKANDKDHCSTPVRQDL